MITISVSVLAKKYNISNMTARSIIYRSEFAKYRNEEKWVTITWNEETRRLFEMFLNKKKEK